MRVHRHLEVVANRPVDLTSVSMKMKLEGGYGREDLRSVRSHLEQQIRYPTSTLHAQRQSPALRIKICLKEYVLRLVILMELELL
jgi:hypothetical protein